MVKLTVEFEGGLDVLFGHQKRIDADIVVSDGKEVGGFIYERRKDASLSTRSLFPLLQPSLDCIPAGPMR